MGPTVKVGTGGVFRVVRRLTYSVLAWLSGIVGLLLLVAGMVLYGDATKEPRDPNGAVFSGVYVAAHRADREINLDYIIQLETGRVTLVPGISAVDVPGGGVEPGDSLRLLLAGGAVFPDGITIARRGKLTRDPIVETTTVRDFFNTRRNVSIPLQIITLYPELVDASTSGVGEPLYSFPTVSGLPEVEIVRRGSNRTRVTLPDAVGVLPIGCAGVRAGGINTVPVDMGVFDLVETPIFSKQSRTGTPEWWMAGHCTKSVQATVRLFHGAEWRLDVASRPPDSHFNSDDHWTFSGPRRGREGLDLGNLSADYVSGRRQEANANRTAVAGLLVGIGGSLLATEVSVRARRVERGDSRGGRGRGPHRTSEVARSYRAAQCRGMQRSRRPGGGIAIRAGMLVRCWLSWYSPWPGACFAGSCAGEQPSGWRGG